MSLSEKKDVPQLVKYYRSKYPDLERDLLRKLIRLELKIGKNASELKKLDRYLGKAFTNEVKLSTEEKPSEVNPYVWLNEKERKLYRLDVEGLNIIKRMAVAGPEWAEWVKREEEEFRQKWGIVTP